jgi:hypothetical protein
MAETPGDRLYMIRLACGDGLRRAEPLPEFVERVKETTGKAYHPATLSLLERMQQEWRLRDIDAFAAVDPLGRGRAWLAVFDEEAPATSSARGAKLEEPPIPAPRPSAQKAQQPGRKRA